jgi:hypothetical protein
MNLFELKTRCLPLIWAGLIALAISGCGGGGGSGGEGDGPSITLTAAYQATQTVRASYQIQTIQVRGKAEGDLNRLDGKTIYVRSDGPPDLFDADIVPSIYPGTAEFNIDILGGTPASGGRRTGTLTIDLCYDKECRQPLDGSPFRVPYDITVLAGLSLATTDVAFSTVFGGTPATKDIAIGLPDGVTTWNVARIVPADQTAPLQGTGASKVAGPQTSQGIVRLLQYARPPGTYIDQFRVVASVEEKGMGYQYEQQVTVTSTITPNATVDAWLAPTPVVFTRVQDDDNTLNEGYSLVPNDGISLDSQHTEYLSHPDAATGHVMVELWWSFYPMPVVGTCGNSGDCLPAGTYQARDVYTYVKDGQTKTFIVPLTLNVVTGP